MIKTSYQLDISSKFDAEPLGNLLFSDGLVSIILENTYLDSWFLSLLTKIDSVGPGSSIEVSILEEPVHVDLTMEESDIVLSYMGKHLRGDYKDYQKELVACVKKFLDQVTSMGWAENNKTIQLLFVEIERFNSDLLLE